MIDPLLDNKIFNRFFLASIPFLAYTIAYNFEYRYLKYFSIPKDFISLNLLDIINVSGLILAVISPIFIFLFILPHNDSLLGSALSRTIFNVFITAFLLFVPDFLVHYHYNQLSLKYLIRLWPLYLAILSLVIAEFGFFRIFKFWDKNYLKNIMDYVNKTDESNDIKDSIGAHILRRYFGIGGYIFFVILIFLFMLSSRSAIYEAQTKQTFMVVNQNKVIIKVFNDNLIVVPFDEKTKKFKKEFSILKFNKNMKIRTKKIGPLSPEF